MRPICPRTSARVVATTAALVAAVVSGASATAAAVPGAALAGPQRTIGVSLPSYHYDAGKVTDVERLTGHEVDVLQTFVSWQYDGHPERAEFPAHRARQIHATGATLEVSWAPSNPRKGSHDPQFALAGIARGDHDAYVRRFAAAVRDAGEPVRIRFGHEMNGRWQPWNESRSGNHPGDFARAWRHLHEVFEQAGASNAIWVWSPNVVGPNQTPLAGLYPGDASVDEVGIDGYSYPRSGCPSPERLFGPTIAQVRRLSPRPVRLAEVAVATTCPARARWITSLFDYLDATPSITGLTWWQRSGDGYDWRVTDGAALEAMRAGLARSASSRASSASAGSRRASTTSRSDRRRSTPATALRTRSGPR